jgi:hypothetical protein
LERKNVISASIVPMHDFNLHRTPPCKIASGELLGPVVVCFHKHKDRFHYAMPVFVISYEAPWHDLDRLRRLNTCEINWTGHSMMHVSKIRTPWHDDGNYGKSRNERKDLSHHPSFRNRRDDKLSLEKDPMMSIGRKRQ